MKITDLRPGDILIFSGGSENPVSDSITYLTKSPVNHAAMVYTNPSEIIEETPPAVHVNSVKARINGGKISVMRHHPMEKSYAPVLDVARNYLNYNHPYSNGSIYTLGLLLLYRRFIPGANTQKVMVKIFKKIASDLLDYVDRFIYPGKSPMCCSQFIYRCYETAGDEYHLDIAQRCGYEGEGEFFNGKSVLRQVIHKVKNDTSDGFRRYILDYSERDLGVEITQSDDELAKDLYVALQADHDHQEKELNHELVVAIHEFSQAVYYAMTGISINYNELENANKYCMVTSGLSLLCLEEYDFVTPSDLLNNCTNLRLVGEI